jgi:Glyoxalase-like domain
MAFLPAHPVLDHLVIDVRDRMATGAARMAALGFQLTPMGKHSLGSANHLAVFGEDYLELLGTDVPGGALRPDIATYPVGLNGLVFRTEAAEALSARLVAHGVPALPAQSFHRPVDLPDGAREEARFRTVRLDRGAGFDGRIYWCEHLTPQHVWRPEWQVHPNGVTSIARVLVSARDPERQAAMFRRIFGEVAVGQGPEGRVLLPCGPVTVEVAPHATVAAELGAAAPDPAGRGDHLVLVALRVRDLAATSALLRAKGVSVEAWSGGLRVAAEPALNATLDFLG